MNVGGGVGSFASADAHQEISGKITGPSSQLRPLSIKTGRGKLTLSGSASDFSGGKITKFTDDSGTKDGGILVANHASALGSGTTTVEHGNWLLLEILPLPIQSKDNQTTNRIQSKKVLLVVEVARTLVQ